MFLLQISFRVSRVLKRPVMMGYPMAISIEPTTACNLRCPECPSGLRAFTRPVGSLSLNQYKAIIESQHRALWYLNLYFQGEPYLNRDFLGMVSIASRKGIFTATSTNGHYLNDENARDTVKSGLDKLIVSVDGADQETYELYRKGGSLNQVLDGIANVVRWKKKLGKHAPLVVLQFILFRTNQHQVEAIKKIAAEAKVDQLTLKTAQLYDVDQKAHLIPENPSWSRYIRKPDGSFSLKGIQADHCWRMWSSSVITWDGRIIPCCFDKDARHQLGQLGELNFKQIWKGETYKQFRQQILHSRKDVDICTNCTEGTRVWA